MQSAIIGEWANPRHIAADLGEPGWDQLNVSVSKKRNTGVVRLVALEGGVGSASVPCSFNRLGARFRPCRIENSRQPRQSLPRVITENRRRALACNSPRQDISLFHQRKISIYLFCSGHIDARYGVPDFTIGSHAPFVQVPVLAYET